MTDDLLVKYLLGETSPEEAARVRTWIEADSANSRYYEHFALIWQQSRGLSDGSAADEEAAWQKFRQRIRSTPAKPTERPFPLPRMIRPSLFQRHGRPPFFPNPQDPTRYFRSLPQAHWMRVAALFLLTATVTGILYLISGRSSQPLRTLSSLEMIVTDTLPDGSVVTLNKHSTLSYQWKSASSERMVRLEGEAFFSVSPDKNRPFIVSTRGISIKVLGTSFNVRNKEQKTAVIVETGLVQISNPYDTILAGPHEMTELEEEDRPLTKTTVPDALYKYYRTREFDCDNTPLWKLVETLNEAYNVHITIGRPSLRKLLLSTTFRDESLDRILTVIGETFSVRVSRNGDQIILQ